MVPASDILLEFVDDLLGLPTREQQTAFVRAEGLLNPGGLQRLLGFADGLLNDNPDKARRLAELCAGLADADALAAVPRADYIRVQAHFAKGEYDVALSMAESAYREYAALGMNLDALRTNVGRMAVLLELGLYEEALDAGLAVLSALDGKGDLDVRPTQHETDLLVALVQQNRGGCLEYMGRYDEALRAYALAEERYRDLDMMEGVGEVLDNRGAILSALGRGSEALAAHKAAAAIFEAAGLTRAQVMSLGNIGETHLRLANYMDALDAFEQARSLLGNLDAPVDESLLLRDTADAYLALNLHSEALAAYREAEGVLRDAGMAHDRARTLWGMGSAMIARSEFEGAEEALAEAARLFAAADNAPMLSGVMLEQASLTAARGDRATALATARRAFYLVSKESWPVQQVYTRLRLADLLLPDTEGSEPHLLAARRLADHLALPQLRYRLDERLGHLRRLQGRDEEARVLLEAAVDGIERLRGTVAQDALRISFLQDKTAAYEDLLALHLARDCEDSVRRAFTVAERAKSRALVDLLTGVTEREASRFPDSEMEGRIQRLQADLNAIYGGLLGASGDDGRPVSLPRLHARATELEQEISRLRLQRTATDAPQKPFAAPMRLDVVQELLPDDVGLLAFHVVGDEVMGFLDVGGRVRVARRLSTVGTVQRLSQRLTAQWGRFRLGRGFAERNMALLERSTRRLLSALYDELMAPLEPILEEAGEMTSGEVSKLAVVPHGPLHRVPFHALFDGERYLLERFEVSYAPSATVFALCQAQVSGDPEKALVLGVEDPAIPAAALEAHAIAERLPEAELRVGDEATVTALHSASRGCDVLHLACHGLFRSDNPMFSALKLRDGWLTAADAMQLSLTGALVTLSACESGRSEVIGGDEVAGLTRAFLGAGAATLVVSLWLAQDETTADLMGRWYERLQSGEERAAALRAAQLEVKERYPHPYYWAPFVLIGKR